MVFVNNQKFACESCIKGHRSSSCAHTDRPLFEIKRKGRPVSQCEKCRELRKTKRMHNKCNCMANSCHDGIPTASNAIVSTIKTSSLTKCSSASRFKPIAPALPNGLKDVFSAQGVSNAISSHPGSKVSTPSNSCHCTNSWNCQCRAADNASSLNLPSSSVTEASSARRRNGLVTLAQAAAFCCNQELPLASDPLNHPPTTTCVVSSQVAHSASTVEVEQSNERRKHRRYHDGLSSDPYFPPQPKRHKLSLPFTCEHESHALQTTRGPDLPPILYPYSNSLTSASEGASPSPTFPDIPPLSTIASLAGSGCCCGLQCSCPGCVEHRGAEHVSEDFNDCDDGCGTCVDNDGGIELPSAGPAFSSGESSSSSTSRFIDAFLARAASLPLPPRTRTAALDATNVTVYPSTLFLGAMKEREERGVAFGLVSLPPLECGCSGGCGCPEGRCECGDECGGCCASEIDSRDSETVGISMSAPTI
ncbi:hypothetical protein AcV7_000176 [Taiwanofungus camphoratus]|nr:hypothetical protein AcV7_000176 [Antrodia cinnamomea]